jgi:hypothetical protein
VWQATCSPFRNPLSKHERQVIRFAFGPVAGAMGRALARAAGVPRRPSAGAWPTTGPTSRTRSGRSSSTGGRAACGSSARWRSRRLGARAPGDRVRAPIEHLRAACACVVLVAGAAGDAAGCGDAGDPPPARGVGPLRGDQELVYAGTALVAQERFETCGGGRRRTGRSSGRVPSPSSSPARQPAPADGATQSPAPHARERRAGPRRELRPAVGVLHGVADGAHGPGHGLGSCPTTAPPARSAGTWTARGGARGGARERRLHQHGAAFVRRKPDARSGFWRARCEDGSRATPRGSPSSGARQRDDARSASVPWSGPSEGWCERDVAIRHQDD